MKLVRRLHLYLSCFFAPMLLFYVGTGWYQTLTLNRTKTAAEAGDWITRLRAVHVDQIYPTAAAASYQPAYYKALVVAMSVALIVTVGLGLFLAFRVSRKPWLVWLVLASGVLVPVATLWFGRRTGP
jgi:hypothetical protein